MGLCYTRGVIRFACTAGVRIEDAKGGALGPCGVEQSSASSMQNITPTASLFPQEMQTKLCTSLLQTFHFHTFYYRRGPEVSPVMQSHAGSHQFRRFAFEEK